MRLWELAVPWLAVVGFVRAEEVAVPQGGDARLREVLYDATEVLRLDGRVGYHIDLELEPGERFVSVAAGDAAAVEVGAEGHHVMVKPKVARVATNLTLLTDRRVYHFEYRVGGTGPVSPVPLYAVKFRYPAPPAAMVGPPLDPRATTVTLPRHTDYRYCGSKALRPVAAWDDGLQLHLKFAATGEWPAIYARGDDGAEHLVNSHVEHDELVVHRLAPRFELRRGKLRACVERRGGGSARRAASGTVSESVVRVRHGETS